MLIASIPYPGLDPVLLRLGPLAIRWYGVAYLMGFGLGYLLLLALIRRGMLRISRPALVDLIGWIVLGIMLGGRSGWWLFYHRDQGTAEAWYEPFAIWHGGMSFHGGLIGVTAALSIWSWIRRAPVLNIADATALAAPVGLFFGRVANFVNAELVGRPTDVPWGMIFPGDSIPCHPSQLYEALLEGPVLLIILWTTFLLCRLRDGRIAALFLIVYGLLRFLVEFTRQPDAQLGFIAFGWLTMGQLLSLVLTAAGFTLFAFVPNAFEARSKMEAELR